jgi:hypothetical protein
MEKGKEQGLQHAIDNGEFHLLPVEGKKRQQRLDPMHSLLPYDLLLPILPHLDVKTLIMKKQVCPIWHLA